jgi:hypothetical protein
MPISVTGWTNNDGRASGVCFHSKLSNIYPTDSHAIFKIRIYYILNNYIYELCSDEPTKLEKQYWYDGALINENVTFNTGSGLSSSSSFESGKVVLQVFYGNSARIDVEDYDGQWHHDVVFK